MSIAHSVPTHRNDSEQGIRGDQEGAVATAEESGEGDKHEGSASGAGRDSAISRHLAAQPRENCLVFVGWGSFSDVSSRSCQGAATEQGPPAVRCERK